MNRTKIAIATENDYVAQHFGRCPNYTVFELEDNEIVGKTSLDNPGHQPGAIPKFLNEQGVNCIVSGGMGQRAQGFFDEFGITTILGVEGQVEDVMNKLLKGEITGGKSLCAPGSGKGKGVEKTVCDHGNEKKEESTCHHSSSKNVLTNIAVTSQDSSLDSSFDLRFGRCLYFIIYNTETNEFKAVSNENSSASGGAGTGAAQIVADAGIEAVISGNFGPNAVTALQTFDIKMYTSRHNTVKEVIDAYKNGQLAEINTPTVSKKNGL